MTEKRFNANGKIGVLVWYRDQDNPSRHSVPYFRIYAPCDPETGWAKRKTDGSPPDYKDYKLLSMIDPSVQILDEHFEFVEKENGKCYLDFSLKTLGRSES